ncbi:hypothetical protein TSUD_297030 [Trifolium subterraneum]|uniref:Uncharacterized protein n=1 Tax=Trifolium subterraneum TaxID=3900 RepID=A0A2Z6N7T3_TRISU|nr:hypothetical protein TSUD_297030 [Trifolium subterraneum]
MQYSHHFYSLIHTEAVRTPHAKHVVIPHCSPLNGPYVITYPSPQFSCLPRRVNLPWFTMLD